MTVVAIEVRTFCLNPRSLGPWLTVVTWILPEGPAGPNFASRIGDRSGALAEVISLLGNLDVNIYDLVISRDGSVLMLEIDAKDHEVFSRVLSTTGNPQHS